MVSKNETMAAYCFGISMFVFRLSIALGNIFFILGIIFCISILYQKKKTNSLRTLYEDDNLKKTYKIFGIMMLSMVPSIIFSSNFTVSIKAISDLWLYRSLMFFAIPLFIRDRKLLETIFIAFVTIEAIEGIVAVYQVLVLQLHRGVGFNITVLEYAGILLVLLPVIIVCMIDDKVGPFLRKSSIILFPFLVAGAIAGQSRGLWLIILAVGPILVFKYVIKNKKYLAVVSIIVITIVGGFISTPELTQRVYSITNTTTDRSNADRILLWESTVEMIKDHPIVGVGTGNWYAVYKTQYENEEVTQKHLNHSHSNYLQIISETGVIGILGFLVFSIYMIFGNFIDWKRFGNPYSLMLFGVWFSFSAFGFIDHSIGSSANAKTLWYITGILLALKMNWNNNFKEKEIGKIEGY